MDKPKIIIQVSGGNVNAVMSNQDIDIVIVDYDNLKEGSVLDSVLSPDIIFEDGAAHNLYSNRDKYDAQICAFLHKKKF